MARAVNILPRKSKTLGAFSRMHKRNTIKFRQISYQNLQNGFIVRMDYFGKHTKRFKTSHYLIIEPRYENYVHVFDIDFIPASALRYIVTLTQDKTPGNFIFANQAFSFLNFKQSKKALYRLLYPIMQKSYRKLIRSGNNIKRTMLVDYNFSKMRQFETPKFVQPSLKKEKQAFENIALELQLSKRKLNESANNGIMRILTPAIWSNIVNTNSWNFDLTQTMAREFAEARGKSTFTFNMLLEAMKLNHTFEAPIIMQTDKNEYYVVAGEVRLLIAMALRITPKAYIFTYNQEK